MTKIRQFGSIAFNAVREIVREPAFLLASILLVYLCGMMPSLVWFAFGEQLRLVRDGAFAFHLVVGLVAGSVAASVIIYRETLGGTAAVILAKPVSRDLFFTAKFCGLAVGLLMFSAIGAVATLLSVRMGIMTYRIDPWIATPLFGAPILALLCAGALNYSMRRAFTSHAFVFLVLSMFLALLAGSVLDNYGRMCRFGVMIEWRLLSQSILITMAVLVLSAVASVLSTRLRPEFTMVACFALFFAGLLSDYYFGDAASRNMLIAFVYYLLPNWQHFWVVDALSNGGEIPGLYVARALLYGGLYMLGVVGLGVLSFRRVQVG